MLLLCHSLEWLEHYIVEKNIQCMIRGFNLRLLHDAVASNHTEATAL